MIHPLFARSGSLSEGTADCVDEVLERAFCEPHLPAAIAPVAVGDRGARGVHEVIAGERLQLEDAASAHECLVNLEKGIFRCCPDQDDGTVLDPGKERVLLRAVPPVNFVHEKDGSPSVYLTLFIGSGDRVANLLNARKDGVQRHEVAFCVIGDNPCERGFSRAGRSVKDDRGELIRLYGATEQPARPDDMILTDVLVKETRSHSGRKRFMLSCRGPRKKIHLLCLSLVTYPGALPVSAYSRFHSVLDLS